MTEQAKKRWGMNFINGAYAVAVALLFVLLLRTIAVQITPPPELLNEPYPDVNTPERCEEQGGRWIEDSRAAKDGRPVPAPVSEDGPTGYCQGPLTFERNRAIQEEASRQTSLFVFAIGGALAVAASLLMKAMHGLPAGFMLGGIFSFFVAGTQLWLLSPGIGRLITMVLIFGFVVGVGWYVFREQGKNKRMGTAVAILGVGSFGSALEHVLRQNPASTIELWDKDESKVPGQKPIGEVMKQADIVCLCVCSWSARAALKSIAPHVTSKAIIVSPIKGLEQKTLYTTEEVIADVLPDNPVALLIGPMLSKEMMANQPVWSTLAAEDRSIFETVDALAAGTPMALSFSDDVHGAALAGVLKNTYAIGGGILEALGYGNNVRGWFIQTALQEMAGCITVLGGQSRTAYTLAGLGDLVATATSPLSRNRTIGEQLVMEGECTIAGEGLISFPYLMELLGERATQYPLLQAISGIVNDKQPAQDAFARFLA